MSDERKMRWQEPWFFSLRMRNRVGWQRKWLVVLAICFAMLAGWYLDQRYGKGPRIGLLGATTLCLGISLLLGFLSDLVVTEVSLTKDGIIRSIYGHGFGASLWRYSEVSQFALLPSEKSGNPFGLLFLITPSSVVCLGIPRSVSQTELAENLRGRGLQEEQISSTWRHSQFRPLSSSCDWKLRP